MISYHELSFVRLILENWEERCHENGDTVSEDLVKIILTKMPAPNVDGPFTIVPTARVTALEAVMEAGRKVANVRQNCLRAEDVFDVLEAIRLDLVPALAAYDATRAATGMGGGEG